MSLENIDPMSYNASNIEVLEGLEAVRKRPAMYIGSTSLTGLHHLLWEIVDNAIDEAMEGHCSQIDIELEPNGYVKVSDNGRGIPVDIHQKTGKSALETVIMTLHAGGKFNNKVYHSSGGLHGVGISVVNALSESMIVMVQRNGKIYKQEFARGIKVSELKEEGSTKGRGTSVFFKPDAEIFSTTEFNIQMIIQRLKQESYLNKRVRLTLTDNRSEKGIHEEFCSEKGLADYIEDIIKSDNLQAVYETPLYIDKSDEVSIEAVIQFVEERGDQITGFANSVYTKDGGTHINALRNGFLKGVRNFLKLQKNLPKGMEIKNEDIRKGLLAIVHVKLNNPQFEGQTKGHLNNTEITPTIENTVRLSVENFLNQYPESSSMLVELIYRQAQARLASNKAQEDILRKSPVNKSKLRLPGKLADCASNDNVTTELYIVEGDSAGGSAKQGRFREFQAILPLRGKILNVENVQMDKILTNQEISNVISALGCGIGSSLDLSKLRYSKVIIAADADSDGNHITVLLITFFYRFMKRLIETGKVYISVPPLYRLTMNKSHYYIRDDQEKESFLKKYKGKSIDIQRFKGLGEMNPAILRETIMDPESRTLMQATLSEAEEADRIIELLMGKEAKGRFDYIKEHALDIEELDI